MPDKRGRVSAGKDNMGGSSANRLTDQSGGLDGDVLGDTGGLETHDLTTDEIPSHGHELPVKSSSISVTNGNSSFQTTGDPQDETMGTESTGGGNVHNNIQPTIIFNSIIKI